MLNADVFDHAEITIYENGNDEQIYMRSVNRSLPFYVMSYVRNGTALLRTDGKEYLLRPRSVILVPPNARHDHIKTGDRPTRFFWWHFMFTLYGSIDLIKLMRLPMVFDVQENDAFESAFMRFDHVCACPPTLQNTILKKAYANEIMAFLIGAAEISGSVNSLTVPDIFLDMLNTVATGNAREVSLSALSEKYNLHPTYISNKFKEYFGISPIRFHQDMLINRARQMLLYQCLPVSEVADALGYVDLSAFSRMFTNRTGIAPSKYAKARHSERPV